MKFNAPNSNVEITPFPHLVMENVIPADLLTEILAKWPNENEFSPEGSGRHHRAWANLITLDSVDIPEGRHQREFWLSITRECIVPLIERLAEVFFPYYRVRYDGLVDTLQVNQAVCFAAIENYRYYIHPHHHYNECPHFLFSVLIYLHDNGFEDRGTRLWGLEHRDSYRGDDFLKTIVVNRTELVPVRPLVEHPFRPNTMLAWLDSPVSYHDTMPFNPDLEGRGQRKILRFHVSASTADFERAFGARKPQEHLAAIRYFAETGDFEGLGIFRQTVAREEEVLRSWAEAKAGAPAKPLTSVYPKTNINY